MTGKTEEIRRKGSTYGLKKAESLLSGDIRRVAESRGFAVSRLLTHWEEVVGADLAAMCRPLDVSWAKGGMGATLTVLARGAEAPMVSAEAERLRARVNGCYGYGAIARIRITQTAPGGFAEGATPFAGAAPAPRGPSPEAARAAAELAEGITDPRLKAALASLGAHVINRAEQPAERKP